MVGGPQMVIDGGETSLFMCNEGSMNYNRHNTEVWTQNTAMRCVGMEGGAGVFVLIFVLFLIHVERVGSRLVNS